MSVGALCCRAWVMDWGLSKGAWRRERAHELWAAAMDHPVLLIREQLLMELAVSGVSGIGRCLAIPLEGREGGGGGGFRM